MAENNAWSEEQRKDVEETEKSSREDSVDLEEAADEAQKAEKERIAKAIRGEGEFLSEELKGLMKEVELVHRLKASMLSEEIEARLRGVVEPSVEKIKGEMKMIEEKFLVDILSPIGERATEKQAPSMDEARSKPAS
jgi:hypothetical protein